MFERLRIRNFRGFGDLRIDSLGRINLVTGRNNVGKTTLLEAIFLLSGAANAHMALNAHIIRNQSQGTPPRWMADTWWKPLFSGLDTNRAPEISGSHSRAGGMKLTIRWERPSKEEFSRDEIKDMPAAGSPDRRSLKFEYEDRNGKVASAAQETADKLVVEPGPGDGYAPFSAGILQPGGGDANENAVRLGRLRRRKRGQLLLDALRVVEPGLAGVEDNTASGAPMIWVDVGLPELVPLPVAGAGMTHVARMVLAAVEVEGGVLLVDELENGLHHSVLPDVWRVIEKAAADFDVQVFATTHSFECVEAAHEALGPDGFRLHRIEAEDGGHRCVTPSPTAIAGAVRHNMEVR